MKRIATKTLMALAMMAAMCATARPAAAAPTLQFFQMGDLPNQEPAGAWFAFPTNNYCGLFHLYFIQGTDRNGPIYNPDGSFSLPLADGVYDFTLLGSGGITGPEANLILSFAEGSFTIDTLHPNGSATFGQTTVTVANFTFENYGTPGLTDRIGTCNLNPDGYVDAVGHLTLEVLTIPINNPPDVSAATPSTTSIWPPNNKMVDIAINGVTDPDGDAVSITITSITNNETGSADAAGIGTATAQVRAARNGKGNGRTYTISFTASDGKGGTASGSVTVSVPHDQGRAKPTAVENATWGEVKNSQQ